MRTYRREEEYNLFYHAGVFIIILLLALLLYALLLWAWDSPAELGAQNMLMRMKPAAPPRPDIAIVGIDSLATAEIGGLPWSRATHARVLRAVRDAGADMVVYDVLLPAEEGGQQADDRAFWQAMTAERNVYLPMTYDPLRRPAWNPADIRGLVSLEQYTLKERIIYPVTTPFYRYYYFNPPWADFTGAAAGVGVAVSECPSGRGARCAGLAHLTTVRYPVPSSPLPRNFTLPQETGRTVVVPGLPLLVALGAFQVPAERVEVVYGRSIRLLAELSPFVDIPVDRNGDMLIDYAGAVGSYRYYSAADLLQGRLPEGVLEGRKVFVGVTDPMWTPAMLGTPFGLMPRVEVTANAVATILNRAYIVRSARDALATLLILGVLLGIFLPFVHRWDMGPLSLVLPLAYIVLAVIVLAVFCHALPVIPAVILIILSVVTAALLKPVMFRRVETTPVVEEPV